MCTARGSRQEDAGKLLIGAFEPNAKPWGMNGIPEDFCFDELPEDLEHFAPVLEAAIHRVPRLAETGIRKFFNGPESFSPDQRYMLGEAPNLRNFFVAAGFNSIDIQSAGGVGMVLAHWIVEGHPPFDLWEVDLRRVMPHQNEKSFLIERTSEALGSLYAMHWPFRQYETARGVRRTPLYSRLKELNACFGEVAGWERTNWFAHEQPLARRCAGHALRLRRTRRRPLQRPRFPLGAVAEGGATVSPHAGLRILGKAPSPHCSPGRCCERQSHAISGRTRASLLNGLSSPPASLGAPFGPIWRTLGALATWTW